MKPAQFKHLLYKVILYIKYLTIQLISKKNIVVQYQCFSTNLSLKNRNFGDDINNVLFELILKKKVIPYKFSIISKITNNDRILGVGSIMGFFNINNATVWGTGIMTSNTEIKGIPKKVLAVRGRLTRNKLLDSGIQCPEIYGDPAILFPIFYTPPIIKKHKLGIIPHYSEIKKVQKMSFINQDTLLINTSNYGNWKRFIDNVISCDYIISSSLHGLIIADSYGIPNKWVEFYHQSDDNNFKFRDYYSVFKDCEVLPQIITEHTHIDEIIQACKDWVEPDLDRRSLLDSLIKNTTYDS